MPFSYLLWWPLQGMFSQERVCRRWNDTCMFLCRCHSSRILNDLICARPFSAKVMAFFRAVHRTRSATQPLAKIGDYIICLTQAVQASVYHRQYRIVCFSALKGALCVVRKEGSLSSSSIHAISHGRHLVFEHCFPLWMQQRPRALCILGDMRREYGLFLHEFVVLEAKLILTWVRVEQSLCC